MDGGGVTGRTFGVRQWQGNLIDGPLRRCPSPRLVSCCRSALRSRSGARDCHTMRRPTISAEKLRRRSRTQVAMDAVAFAQAAGRSDGKSCPNDGLNPMFKPAIDLCAPKCGPAGGEGWKTEECRECMSENSPPDTFACKLTQRCVTDLSRLPF